jgi:quercetin dioxygenase-like cupin family protein
MHVRSAGDAAVAKVVEGWGSLTWLASAALLGTATQTLGRVVIRKGEHNPRHRHNRSEEVLYLLSGRLRHTVGDQSIDMGPGDTIVIPAGVFHNAYSISDVDADMIVAYPTSQRDFEPEKAPA